MAHVNFDRWAMPGLDLTMGGKTYTVPAPHGERLNLAIPAFASVEAFRSGLSKAAVTQETLDVIACIDEPFEEVMLGSSAYAEMQSDGMHPEVISRMALYSMWKWASPHGDQIADLMAQYNWGNKGDGSSAEPGEAQGR